MCIETQKNRDTRNKPDSWHLKLHYSMAASLPAWTKNKNLPTSFAVGCLSMTSLSFVLLLLNFLWSGILAGKIPGGSFPSNFEERQTGGTGEFDNSKDDVASDSDTKDSSEWRWRPEDDHPCTVDRMTWDEVLEVFGRSGVPALYPSPMVISSHPHHNEEFRRLTDKDAITSFFPPNFNITLSSSNSFSEHRRTIPLESYLEEISLNDGVTSPQALSNLTWYLFGETYTAEWKKLLKFYRMPPCQACSDEYVALSFGIGNRGSGVQFHTHGPGFSEALHGRKHWVLYPPSHPPPYYHPDQTSRNWMEFVYTNASKLMTESANSNGNRELSKEEQHLLSHGGRPYECTLEPGELIYFPDRWHHATINCDRYTAFVSAFTSEHLFLQDQKGKRVNRGTKDPFNRAEL
jgi:hypothetical protein